MVVKIYFYPIKKRNNKKVGALFEKKNNYKYVPFLFEMSKSKKYLDPQSLLSLSLIFSFHLAEVLTSLPCNSLFSISQLNSTSTKQTIKEEIREERG